MSILTFNCKSVSSTSIENLLSVLVGLSGPLRRFKEYIIAMGLHYSRDLH